MIAALPAYRLKIERARRHLAELKAAVEEFDLPSAFEVITEDDPDAGQSHAKVRTKRCLPADWSMIIGDIIHNARSALDLLMVAVVKRCDPERASYNHVHFVIRETKEAFEAALPAKIRGASPEARAVIESLKPYKGGDEAFWRLHQLDISDKHKAIIPVGAAHKSVGVAPFAFAGAKLPEAVRAAFSGVKINLRPADRQFPLKDGATIFSGPIGQLNDEVNVTIEIAFGEGQVLEGEPLDPALSQVIDFVEGVCDVVERTILA